MIDLHIHSTCSDGTDTIEEIFDKAEKLGLTQIAITDHDTTKGAVSAIELAKCKSFDFIVGCELTADYHGGRVHLLGYFGTENLHLEKLNEFISERRKWKLTQHTEMIKKLNEHGYDISYDEVKEMFPDTILNRVHIAKVLISKGYFKGLDEVFDTCIGKHCPCYVSSKRADVYEYIDLIHECGGIAVLAHPYEYVNENMEEYLSDLLKSSLDGIEVFHPLNKTEGAKILLDIADRYNKLATGGSDYHGAVKKDNDLGCSKVDDKYMLRLN